MGIDEAGADDKALRIETRAVSSSYPAYLSYFAVSYGDVSAEPGVTGSVNYSAVCYYEVLVQWYYIPLPSVATSSWPCS